MVNNRLIIGGCLQGPPFRWSYLGLGEPLCFVAFGPLATCAFYLAQVRGRGPRLRRGGGQGVGGEWAAGRGRGGVGVWRGMGGGVWGCWAQLGCRGCRADAHDCACLNPPARTFLNPAPYMPGATLNAPLPAPLLPSPRPRLLQPPPGQALTPLILALSALVGLTTTVILFCSHFHQARPWV